MQSFTCLSAYIHYVYMYTCTTYFFLVSSHSKASLPPVAALASQFTTRGCRYLLSTWRSKCLPSNLQSMMKARSSRMAMR